MKNYIHTNCQLILDKMRLIIDNSQKLQKPHSCPYCKQKFNNYYQNKHIKISECDLHLLSNHKIISFNLYVKVCEFKIKKYLIYWKKIRTNDMNIIDGLYDIGSKDIYLKTSNFYGKTVFSEHAGFIYFKNEIVNNINVLTNYKIDSKDPVIFLPENSKEAFNVDYIFHTHPTTPFIGSRMPSKIIYEFPSISDILHFVEHHNNGILKGSLVVAPEGLYIIRKNNFDKNKIKLDYELFIAKMISIYRECFRESVDKYKNIKKEIINGEVKICKKDFYNIVAVDFTFIDKINSFLEENDIYIDYYPRTRLKGCCYIFREFFIPFF